MLSDLAAFHKVLGESNRIRILKLLQRKELCVSTISSILGLSNATVSQHLLLLREASAVLPRREGKWIHYRLNTHISDLTRRSIVHTLLDAVKNDEQILSDQQTMLRINRVDIRRVLKTNL